MSQRVGITNTRLGMLLVVSAGLVALLNSPVMATTAPGANSSDAVSFRPVLCFAPKLTTKKLPLPMKSQSKALPSCAPSFHLAVKNLDMTQSPNSVAGRTIGPDPRFRDIPNAPTAKIRLSLDALLPGIQEGGASERYVLGPAQLTKPSINEARGTVLRPMGGFISADRLAQRAVDLDCKATVPCAKSHCRRRRGLLSAID